MNKNVEKITELLDSKKAEDIRVFDVNGASDLWDYYIVCGGNSGVHAKALYDYVEKEMKEAGEMPVHRETGFDSKWLLLDYADVLVHIFDKETRLFYNIEKMWADKELGAAVKKEKAEKKVKAEKKSKAAKAEKKEKKVKIRKTEKKKTPKKVKKVLKPKTVKKKILVKKTAKKKTAKKGR